jgi:sec-independent protein translocase protein TatB
MFGIGLPEMIVILVVALIVVGPEKLPDLARSLAKGVFELKKTLHQVKSSLADEDELIDSLRSDLRKTTEDLKGNLLESDHFSRPDPGIKAADTPARDEEIIEAEHRPLDDEVAGQQGDSPPAAGEDETVNPERQQDAGDSDGEVEEKTSGSAT